MKTYNVKEIAEMLKTNPETVRRWIRLGKLESVQLSRKSGNVVTEQSLHKFLKSTPKYTGKDKTLGVPSLVSSFLEGFLQAPKDLLELTINNSVEINKTIMSYIIEYGINESKRKIAQKKEEIKNIQQEIEYEMSQISKFQKTLNELNNYEKGVLNDA